MVEHDHDNVVRNEVNDDYHNGSHNNFKTEVDQGGHDDHDGHNDNVDHGDHDDHDDHHDIDSPRVQRQGQG